MPASTSPAGDGHVVRFKDLSKSQRRKVLIAGVLRVAIGVLLISGLYAIAPLNNDYGVHPLIVLVLMLLVFGFAIYHSVKRIMTDDYPQLRSVQVAILAVTLYLYSYATLYLSMSTVNPAYFSESLSHVSAFYFTVTVAATVGFGDVTPTDDLSRVIVTSQMLINIALIGVGVRALLALGKMRVSGSEPDDPTQWPESK